MIIFFDVKPIVGNVPALQICTPWYFPLNPTQASQPCDPWQTKDFLDAMNKIPDDQCNHCLPDCDTTIYKTSLTSTKFRRCDEKNMGMSMLCTMDPGKYSLPSIWSQQVKNDYENNFGVMPSYVGDLPPRKAKKCVAHGRNSRYYGCWVNVLTRNWLQPLLN